MRQYKLDDFKKSLFGGFNMTKCVSLRGFSKQVGSKTEALFDRLEVVTLPSRPCIFDLLFGHLFLYNVHFGVLLGLPNVYDHVGMVTGWPAF